MAQKNGSSVTAGNTQELGLVICKGCGDILYTIPTNGFKKIYGICGKETCKRPGTERGGK